MDQLLLQRHNEIQDNSFLSLDTRLHNGRQFYQPPALTKYKSESEIREYQTGHT